MYLLWSAISSIVRLFSSKKAIDVDANRRSHVSSILYFNEVTVSGIDFGIYCEGICSPTVSCEIDDTVSKNHVGSDFRSNEIEPRSDTNGMNDISGENNCIYLAADVSISSETSMDSKASMESRSISYGTEGQAKESTTEGYFGIRKGDISWIRWRKTEKTFIRVCSGIRFPLQHHVRFI